MAEQLELEFNAPTAQLPQLWTPDDIYNSADEEVVRRFSEDKRVERKPCTIHARELGEYLSMWANTQPRGGVTFIGVEDDGSISGCKRLTSPELNKLDCVRDYCHDARHEFKRISVTNKDGEPDFVMVLRVFYRDDKLVETSSHEAFVRVGEDKRRLSEEEKREIRINKGEIDYELEPVTLNWPDDFDMPLVDELVKSYIDKRRITRTTYGQEDILALLHLGKRTGEKPKFIPNLACALLLAKDPRQVMPGARIRISRYDGVEETFGRKLNKIFDDWTDGPLPRQIEAADKVLTTQIRNFTRLGGDGKFYTRPEYPREAWLEAVVNACVHRSYNLKHMNIFVKMFENKFVVESPGGFLPPTTAETVYESHNPRNPYMMEALYYLDFVHCAYEGTRRMRDTMKDAELPPPEFSQKQMGMYQIHVTLKNNVEHRKAFIHADIADLIGSALFSTLSEEEKLIINFVGERGKISVSDAARLIGKDWPAGKVVLEGLRERKILDLPTKSGKVRESSKRYVLRQNGKRK